MAVVGIGTDFRYQKKSYQDSNKTEKGSFLGELSGAVKRAGEKEDEEKPDSEIHNKIQELREKILKGETQQSFQIGASSFTIKEWERFLKRFDETEEDVMEQLKEAMENQKEAAKAASGEDREIKE